MKHINFFLLGLLYISIGFIAGAALVFFMYWGAVGVGELLHSIGVTVFPDEEHLDWMQAILNMFGSMIVVVFGLLAIYTIIEILYASGRAITQFIFRS